MDGLSKAFEQLKVSALYKVRLVGGDVDTVTIGPNRTQTEPEPNAKTPAETETEKERRSLIAPAQKPPLKSRNADDNVSVAKLLAEAEKERRIELESRIRSKIADVNKESRKLDDDTRGRWLMRQQMLIEQSRKQENVMLEILLEHDRKACDFSHQRQLQYQQHENERNKRNLQVHALELQKRNLKMKVDMYMIHFQQVYQEIVKILKGCTSNKSVGKIIANNPDNKTLSEAMEMIRDRVKRNQLVSSDLETAADLVQQVCRLRDIIACQVAETNEHEKQMSEQRQKVMQAEVEKTQMAEQQRATTESAAVARDPQPDGQLKLKLVSKEDLSTYAELQQFLDEYEERVKDISEEPKLKQFKFACQKAVNIPLNAISAVSSQHLADKYARLAALLSGRNVEAGGATVCAAQHPHGVAFCANLLARKMVVQGDLIVSSNPESAHCLGAVLAALWADFPDVGRLFMAHAHRQAPCLVPMRPPPRRPDQTDRDYYGSLGYRYDAAGDVERQDKFVKRVSGVARLLAAVSVAQLGRSQRHDRTHPHGLAYAWRFLAATLNLEPVVDVTATLLLDFIEVAGSSLQAAYAHQFGKMLAYIADCYLPRMHQLDSGGPVCRLEALLQKIKTTGHIEPPKGRLPDGFW